MNIAQVFPGGPALLCKTGNNKRYKVTGQEKVEGNPVTGSKVCHGDDDCVHTEGSSYSVGVIVQVGGDLGLDFGKIASAGLQWSVAIEKTKEEAQGAEVSYPKGPWQCSLAIWPGVLRVKGVQTYDEGMANQASCGETSKDYVVEMPLKEDNHLTANRIRPCACPNREHWADEGAPARCPTDCDG